jgi:hypothetical protein
MAAKMRTRQSAADPRFSVGGLISAAAFFSTADLFQVNEYTAEFL